MKKSRPSAFTLIELLVVISIIGILAAMAIPAITSALTKGQMTGTLNNERQLQLASQQMSLDSTTTGDTTIGWPGDATNLSSVQAWVQAMVPNYMQTNDVIKLFQAPGMTPPIGSISDITAANIPFKVYKVSGNYPGDTIFLVTRNWQGFAQPLQSTSPYQQKGFVLFHMGGDGAIFQARQATNTSATNGGLLGETNGQVMSQ